MRYGWPTTGRRGLVAIVALLTALCGPSRAAAQVFDLPLRIIAPAAPGGGWDVTARAMQAALMSSGLAPSVSVENIPGAAGTIGLARFIGAERGRGDALFMTGTATLLAMISFRSPLSLNEVTPIGRLVCDRLVLVVGANSPYTTFDAFIQAFRDQPESISWTGGSAGGGEETLARLIADAVGIDPRRVNFVASSGNGETNPGVIAGHYTASMGPAASLGQYVQAGTMRVLAVSSAERNPSFDAPTLRERGIDVVFEIWRAVFAPPAIRASDRSKLEQTLSTMTRTPAWQDTLARYGWSDCLQTGPAFAEFLRTEEQRARDLSRRFGTDPSTPTSSSAYPLLVLGGLLVTALATVVGRAKRVMVEAASPRGPRSLALIAVGMLLNLLLLDSLGFILASSALFWVTAQGFAPGRSWRSAILAVALSMSIYAVFDTVLGVTLPRGSVFGVLSQTR